MKIDLSLLDRLNDNPLYRTIGIRVTEADQGRVVSTLEPRPDFCWPFPGQPHGGILSTQMDTTMAWAALTLSDSVHNCTTINLNIQFTAPAKGPPFTCTAWVTHQSRRLSFVRAEVRDGLERLLAMGQGTFRTIKVALPLPGRSE